MVWDFCTLDVRILCMQALEMIKGVLYLTITVYGHHQYLCDLNYLKGPGGEEITNPSVDHVKYSFVKPASFVKLALQ